MFNWSNAFEPGIFELAQVSAPLPNMDALIGATEAPSICEVVSLFCIKTIPTQSHLQTPHTISLHSLPFRL